MSKRPVLSFAVIAMAVIFSADLASAAVHHRHHRHHFVDDNFHSFSFEYWPWHYPIHEPHALYKSPNY